MASWMVLGSANPDYVESDPSVEVIGTATGEVEAKDLALSGMNQSERDRYEALWSDHPQGGKYFTTYWGGRWVVPVEALLKAKKMTESPD